MRRVRIETCTSGDPVSVSCIRESAITSVFSSSVNATLVFYLLLYSNGNRKSHCLIITLYLWGRNSLSRLGCVSFFCKEGLFGSDNHRPPPRMIGRRTAGTTRGWGLCGCQRADRPRGGLSHWTWSRRRAPQPQDQQTLQGLFRARLAALVSLLLAALLPL